MEAPILMPGQAGSLNTLYFLLSHFREIEERRMRLCIKMLIKAKCMIR